jgi:DNA-binding MarR family transcriptional regulator
MGIAAEPHDELTAVERARWRAFSLMSRRLTSAVETRLQREASVSSADFEVLEALSNIGDSQARAKDLAEMLSWEKSRISHQVTRMVDRGLVERTECDVDLRGSWVRLTAQGREARARALPHYEAAVRELYLEHMSESQAVAVTDVALRIVDANTVGTCRAEIQDLEQKVRGDT